MHVCENADTTTIERLLQSHHQLLMVVYDLTFCIYDCSNRSSLQGCYIFFIFHALLLWLFLYFYLHHCWLFDGCIGCQITTYPISS